MDFQLWQGMDPPFARVPLERNTLGSTRTSCNPATHDRPLISLECIECISPTVGISNRFPNGAASTIDFRNKWNSRSGDYTPYFGVTDLAMLPARFLSFTGCEARSYAYHHIRFTLNVTSSNPSNHWLTSSTIHYVLAKRSFLLRFHSWYGWRNQYMWSSGNILSDIRPYKSSRNRMNRRHYSVHPS